MEKSKQMTGDMREVAKQEALQLVVICATDIVNAWPQLTLRELRSMTARIDTLRQAVNEYRKYL